jgi:hypothetical protein
MVFELLKQQGARTMQVSFHRALRNTQERGYLRDGALFVIKKNQHPTVAFRQCFGELAQQRERILRILVGDCRGGVRLQVESAARPSKRGNAFQMRINDSWAASSASPGLRSIARQSR